MSFLKGFIKTTPGGKKAGIFAGFFVFLHKFRPGEMQEAVTSGFAAAGAGVVGASLVELGDYTGEEVTLTSHGGNGLFFRDPDRGVSTTGSFVSVELEKEAGRDVYPFLTFFFAAPSTDFDDLRPEFEAFLRGVTIRPLPASISGKILALPSRTPLPGVRVQVQDSKTNQTAVVTTAADGSYRFDSLGMRTYYLAVVDAPGYKPFTMPRVIKLTSGQDTTGVDFELEPLAVPTAERARHPGAEPVLTREARLGLAYRQCLSGIWGIGVNLPMSELVPELTIGGEYAPRGSALLASLGVRYFFSRMGNLRMGAGVVLSSRLAQRGSRFALEIPVTAEYFLHPDFSIQTSVGPYFTTDGHTFESAVGPKHLLGSMGLTWYLW
ncbi:MAG: carboxypeptidase-like regulatory domain-containing protein [candidate division WOR-3 bacterium]